jgi:uncharacterized protein
MNPPAGAPVVGSRLEHRVQGFLDRLREEGLRSGIGAGVDLSRSLHELSLLDRSEVLEAARATLAKSPSDLSVVDRVFEEYFGLGELPLTPPSEEGKLPRGRERVGRSPTGANGAAETRDSLEEELRGRYSPVAPPPAPPRSPIPSERLRRFRAGARRFRRSVATLPGRRWRAHGVGSVDLRRTARSGLRSGGEFVELARRARSPRRADLVILWDVSGSMREHTTELFGLVYALHRVVRRTRVFAFGHDLVEVTPLLAGRSYERALPMLGERLRPTGGGTRIAHCLTEFRRHHESELRPTSTLLVLSDGWDLGDPEELADQLRRLHGRVHRLVWVNPYAAQREFRPETAALRMAMPFVDLMASPEDFPSPHGAGRRSRVPAPG